MVRSCAGPSGTGGRGTVGQSWTRVSTGFYYEGWSPTHKPDKMDAEAFLGHVRREANLQLDQVEAAVRVAPRTLQHHVSAGELAKALGILPNDIVRVLVS